MRFMCSFVFAEGECQNKGKRNHKQSSKDPVTGADVHEKNLEGWLLMSDNEFFYNNRFAILQIKPTEIKSGRKIAGIVCDRTVGIIDVYAIHGLAYRIYYFDTV
jgi:hypothetical protein